MKTKEEIIFKSKRDLYEYFDTRIKRIEDEMEEMRATEDKPKSVKEILEELKASKEGLERASARLDGICEEEENVTLQLAFYGTKTVPQSKLCNLESGHIIMQVPDERWAVSTRTQGPLAGKAIRLSDNYDWELGKDDTGILCLVPLKKDKEK